MKKGMAFSLVVTIVLALISIVLIWYFHEKIFGFLKDVMIGGIKALIKSIVCGAWLIRQIAGFC